MSGPLFRDRKHVGHGDSISLWSPPLSPSHFASRSPNSGLRDTLKVFLHGGAGGGTPPDRWDSGKRVKEE